MVEQLSTMKKGVPAALSPLWQASSSHMIWPGMSDGAVCFNNSYCVYDI
jgi:hypothetical protein